MSDSRPPHIGIVAGEASGDIIGAAIIRELRERIPNLQCSVVGGDAMRKEDVRMVESSDALGVLGFWQPLLHLPKLLKFRKRLRQHYLETKPDVFLGIDAPDFNLGLERSLRARGIYSVHCVSPSVWAWRTWRIKRIRKSVNMVLCIFPFEVEFYKKHKIPARFIGHPLADALVPTEKNKKTVSALGLNPANPILTILPGSRKSEVKNMARLFAETACRCLKTEPKLQILVSAANDNFLPYIQEQFEGALQKHKLSATVVCSTKASSELVSSSDVVLTASGTASLEVLLLDRPMVIAYRVDYLTYWIVMLLSKIKYYGLPNLLSNQLLVPEIFQAKANPGNLASELIKQLRASDSERKKLKQEYAKVRTRLKKGAAASAAEQLEKILLRGRS